MTRLSRAFARPACAPRHPRSRTRKLAVLNLEDRTTPAQFTVTSLADDGSPGTLRDAINQANATSAADEIVFNPSLFATPQTLTLAQGALPAIASAGGNLTITGP